MFESIQESATKGLLGSTLYSVLLSPICVQPGVCPVVLPHRRDKKTEYILTIPARENPFFDQNVTISILQSEPYKLSRDRSEIEGESVAERFHRLAAEWSMDVRNVSSLSAMSSHPKYRQIVDMRWEVVPLLLVDLQRNRRFWLPALHEITGIQPFDPSDAGNSKRMIDAWLRWGKNKRYI
jgi:hypothetical protein